MLVRCQYVPSQKPKKLGENKNRLKGLWGWKKALFELNITKGEH